MSGEMNDQDKEPWRGSYLWKKKMIISVLANYLNGLVNMDSPLKDMC